MDLPSEWPLSIKILAVVIFVAIMGVFAIALKAIIPIVPDELLSHIVVGGMALAAGFLLGQRSIRRHYIKLGYGPPPNDA